MADDTLPIIVGEGGGGSIVWFGCGNSLVQLVTLRFYPLENQSRHGHTVALPEAG